MTTADWALIVSICSAALSLFSLGWNVWSKWLYPKAKLKIGFTVMRFVNQDGESPPFLQLNATNFGPTDTTLRSVEARSHADGWWYKLGRNRWDQGVLVSMKTPDEAIAAKGAAYNGLPIKLPVGEEFSTYLIFRHQHLRDDSFIDVGFSDIFGRYHWAPRKSVRKVTASIKERWPEATGEPH